jgi:hypothetical protein
MTDDATSEIIVCYGDANPRDTHLFARIVAVDDEIIAWLERRERRQARKLNTTIYCGPLRAEI